LHYYPSAHEAVQSLWNTVTALGDRALRSDLFDSLGMNESALRAGLLQERSKVLALHPGENGDKPPAKASNQGKQVDARMAQRALNDEECHGWSLGRWAKELKCSKTSVRDTPTWDKLAGVREKLKAERALARDRRGRNIGRRMGDHGSA